MDFRDALTNDARLAILKKLHQIDPRLCRKAVEQAENIVAYKGVRETLRSKWHSMRFDRINALLQNS